MRSHPVAGCLFLVIGFLLLAAGFFGNWAPERFPGPLPASLVIPLVLWQLAVWSLLFGVFFLRPRGRDRRRPHPI